MDVSEIGDSPHTFMAPPVFWLLVYGGLANSVWGSTAQHLGGDHHILLKPWLNLGGNIHQTTILETLKLASSWVPEKI